nr:MAG TPA: hypothetical protein [Caudoviricetes sp.]
MLRQRTHWMLIVFKVTLRIILRQQRVWRVSTLRFLQCKVILQQRKLILLI